MTDRVSLIVDDETAPVTDGLRAVAQRRTNDILKAWAKRLSIWGTFGLHGPQETDETFSLRDLVMAAYIQGARDATVVAVNMPAGSAPKMTDREREAVERLNAAVNGRLPFVFNTVRPDDIRTVLAALEPLRADVEGAR